MHVTKGSFVLKLFPIRVSTLEHTCACALLFNQKHKGCDSRTEKSAGPINSFPVRFRWLKLLVTNNRKHTLHQLFRVRLDKGRDTQSRSEEGLAKDADRSRDSPHSCWFWP